MGFTKYTKPGPSEILEEEFLLACLDNRCIGEAVSKSKENFHIESSRSTYVRSTNYLNGDPEFNIWWGLPYIINYEGYALSTQRYRLECSAINKMKVIQFDGQGHSVIHVPLGSTIDLSVSETHNGFKASPLIAYGIWRSDCLPEISLRNCKGPVPSGRYSYIVRDAVLGESPDIEATIPLDLEVGQDCELNIHAIEKVYLGKGYKMTGSAVMNSVCDEITELGECRLTGESKTTVTSAKTTLSEGFSIDAGAILTINPL